MDKNSTGKQFPDSWNNSYVISMDNRLMLNKITKISGILRIICTLPYQLCRSVTDKWTAKPQGKIIGALDEYKNGINFLSYNVGDTYGIINVERPIGGVELTRSLEWEYTDYNGLAIAPEFAPRQLQS